MFTITDLIRNTANVLNHVQKHGNAVVKGRGRPGFTIVESSEYKALVKDRDDLLAQLDEAEAHHKEMQQIIDSYA